MITNSDYFFHDYCCLRLPAKPIDSILKLNEDINSINLEDNKSVSKMLEVIFSDSFFEEAIFIASKDLHKVYIESKVKGFKDNEDAKKMLTSFYKYISRMSFRATPYGLFAGVTSTLISEDATNILFSKEKYNLSCQLNIHSVTRVIREINPLGKNVISSVKYHLNKTLYVLGDRVYFVEQFNNGRYLASNLTSVRLTEFISIVLDCAKNGATINEIVNKINSEKINTEKKSQYVNSLIKSQVLVCEYWPSVSTDDFMKDFLEYLNIKEIKGIENPELENMYALAHQLKSIDELKNLRERFNNNFQNSLYNDDFLKIDLFYNMESSKINKQILEEIYETSFELAQLCETKTSSYLENFISLFNNKYDQKEVLLVEAIDPNYGVGYGKIVNGFAEFTPLLEDIPIIPLAENEIVKRKNKFDTVIKNVFKKYSDTKDFVINIDDEIKIFCILSKDNLSFNTNNSPSRYIFGSILAKSSESLDNGEYKFLSVQLHAPFAAKLISRFAHGEENLKEQIKAIAKHEQSSNPNAILAEILTIPDDKYANVSLNPTLREYEIPYLSNSKLNPEKQIKIKDLLISVKNGRVILRSINLKKEIIPCLSNTYNIAYAQPVFRLLADIAAQSITTGEFWNWGQYNTEMFLPRIEYKKMILSRARWLIMSKIVNIKNVKEVNEFIKGIIQKFDLPKFVVLSEGDNEFLLDLDNSICKSILIKEVSKRDVILFEHLFVPENCFIKENGESFTNEIIIPIGTRKPYYAENYFKKIETSELQVQRIFPPGSEWLFIKLYTGSKNLEKILTEIIVDFTKDLMEQNVIDKWFFIRYNDPDYHLRIRFHKYSREKNDKWYLILENLNLKLSILFKEDSAVKIMTDTYTREIERYGNKTIEQSENIFSADSIAIGNFLSLISGDEGEVLRWKFAFVSIDRLLNDFEYNIEMKFDLIKSLSEEFLKEFSHNNRQSALILTKSMNNKFRKFKHEISAIIENELEELKEAYDCFNERSICIKKEIKFILKFDSNIKNNLLSSYIHISLNRLFLIDQRRHELAIYYLLNKYYDSVISKLKFN